MPSISVLMPAYNAGDYISEAIRHARELILDHYNLFAFLCREIEADSESPLPRKRVRLPAELSPSPLKRGLSRIKKMIKKAA